MLLEDRGSGESGFEVESIVFAPFSTYSRQQIKRWRSMVHVISLLEEVTVEPKHGQSGELRHVRYQLR